MKDGRLRKRFEDEILVRKLVSYAIEMGYLRPRARHERPRAPRRAHRRAMSMAG